MVRNHLKAVKNVKRILSDHILCLPEKVEIILKKANRLETPEQLGPAEVNLGVFFHSVKGVYG